MNISSAIKEGQEGKNFGLNTCLDKFDTAVNGVQKGEYIVLGGESKTGKSSYLNVIYVISLYLCNPGANIKWIYYSFEMSRIETEARFIAYLLFKDYDIDISYNKILGRERDEEGNLILLNEKEKSKIEDVINTYIYPLFGKFDKFGRRLTPGKIDFIEQKENPTGVHKYLKSYAEQNGRFITETFKMKEGDRLVSKKRIIGYTSDDDSLHTIVILDHIRKLKIERGFTMKQNIDKMSEYFIQYKNWCKYTIIAVVHLNRAISDITRIKYLGDKIYPTDDSIKDSGLEMSIFYYIFHITKLRKYGSENLLFV